MEFLKPYKDIFENILIIINLFAKGPPKAIGA